jgi:polyhydroxybutyrate depolymerase
LPAGSFAHKIKVGGVVGTYRTYRPASLPAGAPIVVMLNPSGGSASQTERDYHWDAEADSGHFVVAYPDWQDYAGANEIDFFSAIVAAIERHNPIDSSRVYVAGISLGGTEAYYLVCSTTIFAAIGVDSAREFATCAHPAPISVIHIHGTADHIVPYHRPPLFDIPQINATWRRIDHCDAPAVTTAGAVTTSVAACPDGRTVELITIAGAGHQWPGGVPHPGVGDPPSTALNATQVIWEFFAKQHR